MSLSQQRGAKRAPACGPRDGRRRVRKCVAFGGGGAASGDFRPFSTLRRFPGDWLLSAQCPIRPRGRQKGESGRFRRGAPARLRGCAQSSSSSFIHRAEQASLGMRQSQIGRAHV